MEETKMEPNDDNSIDSDNLTNLASKVSKHSLHSFSTFQLSRVSDSESELKLQAYFELPRRKCEEISPELLRLSKDKKTIQQHRLHIFKKMLKTYRAKCIPIQLKHIKELDESEKVSPLIHGKVSQQLFNSILGARDHDLYGRRMKLYVDHQKEAKLKEMAKLLNITYLHVTDEKVDPELVPEIFGDMTDVLTKPPIVTDPWKVGFMEEYRPPVGFAPNPAPVLNSYGHEKYYPYDGTWKEGKMDGSGVYQYGDGSQYEGHWRKNRPHGAGTSRYKSGSKYQGFWDSGRKSGDGVSEAITGSKYSGKFSRGRREGFGVLELTCGLKYEGDFLDGKFHGRGKMSSKLTGYIYEGNWEMGRIFGRGSIFTPPPESKHVVKYWDTEPGETFLLPQAVNRYLSEVQAEKHSIHAHKDSLFSTLRSIQLKKFVDETRMNLHASRAREKRNKILAVEQAAKEARAKLNEARIQVLLEKSTLFKADDS